MNTFDNPEPHELEVARCPEHCKQYLMCMYDPCLKPQDDDHGFDLDHGWSCLDPDHNHASKAESDACTARD